MLATTPWDGTGQGLFVFLRESPYVVHAGLELAIFLSQPPECWDCKLKPSLPVHLEYFGGFIDSTEV
jgi:hypothetical protein